MSLFLSTMTATGRELLQLLRDAGTPENIGALVEKHQRAVLQGLSGGPSLSDADQFAFTSALAELVPARPRGRAAAWEAAALIAIRAKAHAEALAALLEAEKHARARDRQRWIADLRRILAARGEPLPPPTRPVSRAKKRTRRACNSREGRDAQDIVEMLHQAELVVLKKEFTE